MKVLKKTAEYTVFQKRSGRYAVLDANKKAVNGDDKVAILVAEGYVKQPEPKVEEAPVEEVAEAAEEAEAAVEEPAEEAAAEEEEPKAE
ncbi:MAG: hypothetical protein EP334_08590 [Gammaproteobacteria bacterium]|nr:MAG: hypothetical protein EP334_08590 [Gammaproteobacteria bacterium]